MVGQATARKQSVEVREFILAPCSSAGILEITIEASDNVASSGRSCISQVFRFEIVNLGFKFGLTQVQPNGRMGGADFIPVADQPLVYWGRPGSVLA